MCVRVPPVARPATSRTRNSARSATADPGDDGPGATALREAVEEVGLDPSTVVVLATGDEFKILATIKMGGEQVYSSIVAAEGALFIRTGKNLFCVGKK